MLRATFWKQKPNRVALFEDYAKDIIAFGEQNVYPNLMYQLALSSGNLMKALRIYQKFIKGRGFVNQQFANSRVNKKQTANQLLSDCAKYLSIFHGFYLHVNYNALGYVVSVKCIPFQNGRIGFYEKEGQFAVWDNWANESYRVSNIADIDYIHEFNPDPDVVFDQIQECGGIKNYKGQILKCFMTDEVYPLATFDPIQEIVESDVRKKNYTRNTLKNNLSSDVIIVYPGEFADDKEREDFNKTLSDASGDDNAGNHIVIENPLGFEKPLQFIYPTTQNNDKLFGALEKSIEDNIRSNYLIPAVLMSEADTGLFNQDQLSDAYTFYNNITEDERSFISDCFAQVFAAFYYDNNVENDFSIQPMKIV